LGKLCNGATNRIGRQDMTTRDHVIKSLVPASSGHVKFTFIL
jgi:hypothetical protein